MNNQFPDYVICINNSGYPASLELHKLYRVIPDEDALQDGDLRIIDESGEDYLYPAENFEAPAPEAASEKWDQQIEKDIQAGKLDELAEKVLKDFDAGVCTEL